MPLFDVDLVQWGWAVRRATVRIEAESAKAAEAIAPTGGDIAWVWDFDCDGGTEDAVGPL